MADGAEGRAADEAADGVDREKYGVADGAADGAADAATDAVALPAAASRSSGGATEIWI